LHADHQVGVGKVRLADVRSGGRVRLVRKGGGPSGPSLDADLIARRGQLAEELGHQCDP
jgi:hypothetical protein